MENLRARRHSKISYHLTSYQYKHSSHAYEQTWHFPPYCLSVSIGAPDSFVHALSRGWWWYPCQYVMNPKRLHHTVMLLWYPPSRIVYTVITKVRQDSNRTLLHPQLFAALVDYIPKQLFLTHSFVRDYTSVLCRLFLGFELCLYTCGIFWICTEPYNKLFNPAPLYLDSQDSTYLDLDPNTFWTTIDYCYSQTMIFYPSFYYCPHHHCYSMHRQLQLSTNHLWVPLMHKESIMMSSGV